MGRADLVARIEKVFGRTLGYLSFAPAEIPIDLLEAVLEASRRQWAKTAGTLHPRIRAIGRDDFRSAISSGLVANN